MHSLCILMKFDISSLYSCLCRLFVYFVVAYSMTAYDPHDAGSDSMLDMCYCTSTSMTGKQRSRLTRRLSLARYRHVFMCSNRPSANGNQTVVIDTITWADPQKGRRVLLRHSGTGEARQCVTTQKVFMNYTEEHSTIDFLRHVWAGKPWSSSSLLFQLRELVQESLALLRTLIGNKAKNDGSHQQHGWIYSVWCTSPAGQYWWDFTRSRQATRLGECMCHIWAFRTSLSSS